MSTQKIAAIGVGLLVLGSIIGWSVASAAGTRACHMEQCDMTQCDMAQCEMMKHHSMGSMMHDMAANLQGKTGEAFDRAFIDDMIVHHEGAVDMAEMVLLYSQRPELQAMAQEIITAQTREINQMKQWKQQWFR